MSSCPTRKLPHCLTSFALLPSQSEGIEDSVKGSMDHDIDASADS